MFLCAVHPGGRRGRWPRRPLPLFVSAAAACAVWLATWPPARANEPAAAGAGPVVSLFAAGEYLEARRLLLSPEGQEGEDQLAQLVSLLLEPEPERLRARLQPLASDERQGGLGVRAAYEQAALAFARGRYEEALRPLAELRRRAPEPLPGRVALLVGDACQILHRWQESREAYASVPAGDPAFPWARYQLGRIALADGDHVLALQYFASAERSGLAAETPSLLLGRWEALRLAGRMDEAEVLAARLEREHPRSLAALHLREATAREQRAAAPAGQAPADTQQAIPPEPPAHGRYSLQLAAFSDRGRALAYMDEWTEALPDLRLESEPGPDGELLYKVRSGHFVDRSRADQETARLRRVYGLKAIVVETVAGP
jgi:tetratricopeptide (TPR) repeat protein